MAASAQSLHPAGFVDTGDCSGPRLTRSQPNRESSGVLLNECTDKYQTQFELPYKNIANYLKTLESSWDKLSSQDKQMIVQDIVNNLPTLKSALPSSNKQVPRRVENFTDDELVKFINDNLVTDTEQNTKQLLDALYYPDDNIKNQVNENLRDEIRYAFNDWVNDQNIYFHCNYQTGVFMFLLVVLFFLLGIGIVMASTNGKKR